MKNQPILIEQQFPVQCEKVWRAITDRDEMKQWYFELLEFKLEIGFTFHFTGGPSEDRQYLHICEITDIVPNKKLAYSWRYHGFAGNTLVTFELFDKGDNTLMKLTHQGLETFPAGNPDFSRENFQEGWNWIIVTSLKNFLLNRN